MNFFQLIYFSVQRSAFWQVLISREVQVLINAVSGVQNIATSLITKVTKGDLGGLATGFGQGSVCLGELIYLFRAHCEKTDKLRAYAKLWQVKGHLRKCAIQLYDTPASFQSNNCG